MQFEIGAPVSCEDGPCGVLSRVVIDPIRRAVTHLVVEPRHRHSLARLVPVDLAEVEDSGLKLRCTLAAWRALQFVEENEYVVPPEQWLEYSGDGILGLPYYAESPPVIAHERVPAGEVEVRRGEHVHASDGEIGRVEGVVVDPADHHLTHVLLQEGHLWGKKDVAIPIGAVDRVDWDGVHVSLAKEEIADLPPIEVAYPRP
jgi:sporulation protein YlmC with PRC-barrel domain